MKRLTIEDCHKIAKERGGECLSTRYINAHTKMKWQCNCSHIWEARFNPIKRGSWCPKCARKNAGLKLRLTIEDCHIVAAEKNGKCLSVEYINTATKMEWQCEKGHIWEAKFNDVKNDNSWCPKCARNVKLTIEHCHEIATINNIKCLSTEYINANIPIEWQCEKGHIWKTNINNIKHGKKCPYCKKSKTEDECREIFRAKYNKKFSSIRPNFLKNPETGWNLELDGYCEELKLAFEYDGEQHYQSHWNSNNKESLQKQQQRDVLKDKLCKEAGITLIRIPYWKKDNLEEYITKQLEKQYVRYQ